MQSRPELVGYSAHDGGNRGGHDSDHRAYHDGWYSPDQAPRIVKIGVLDNPQCLRNVGKHRFGMECFRVSSERGFPLWRVGAGWLKPGLLGSVGSGGLWGQKIT